MRKSLQLLGIVMISVVVFLSCSLEKEGNYLTPIKHEIPELLENNIEVVTFIQQNTKDLNNWAIVLEDLVVQCEPYIGKSESELSDTDKQKLGKIMMDLVANMGQFSVYVAEMQQNESTIEYDLNEKELQAFTLIKNQFDIRVEEINTKYLNFGMADEE